MTPYVDVIMLILTFFILTVQFKAELAEDIQKASASGNDTTAAGKKCYDTGSYKWGDVFVDVDNLKVPKALLQQHRNCCYHIDSTSQPGWRDPKSSIQKANYQGQ
jgi:biopolymer transport protein ExbD